MSSYINADILICSSCWQLIWCYKIFTKMPHNGWQPWRKYKTTCISFCYTCMLCIYQVLNVYCKIGHVEVIIFLSKWDCRTFSIVISTCPFVMDPCQDRHDLYQALSRELDNQTHPEPVWAIGELALYTTLGIYSVTWWTHQMETFSVTGEFPAQRPVTRSFDVFFETVE